MVLLTACDDLEMEESYGTDHISPKPLTKSLIEAKREKTDETNLSKKITLTAIGDLLIHDRVYNDARVEKGRFDFSPMFEQVKPFLNISTITIANQETMIGGQAIGLSSYPRFNSPFEFGDTVNDVGVDVVSIANNHTLDRGEEAILNSISHWQSLDMIYTGSYKDVEDSEQVRVLQTIGGIDVAFLSYTYGTNGIPVPENKGYLVNLIDKKKMAADVEKAKGLSDVLIMSLHFGNEYERMPNAEQKDLAQYASDLGVDVVIGHHPHVLQPVEWIEGKEGNKTFVAYSLGNFLSGQDEFYNRIGGALSLTIELKENNGEDEVLVTQPQFLPTFVDYKGDVNTMSDVQIIPMYQLTDSELPNAKKHYSEIKAHMSQWMTELEFMERDV